MSELFMGMAILIQYPWLAAVIGAVFLIAGSRVRRTTVIAAGVIWLLYSAYETGMKQRWLCTGECNIRVDLLLLYPLLLVLLISAIVSLVRARRSAAYRRRT
jgi:hypothetical protein